MAAPVTGQGFRVSLFATVFPALILAGCAGGGPDGGAVDGGTTAATGSISLAWQAPAENEDGSQLEDLAGYRVYDGTSPGRYDTVTDVGRTTQVTLEDMPLGTYYISVTAYDLNGNESGFSNEVAITVD